MRFKISAEGFPLETIDAATREQADEIYYARHKEAGATSAAVVCAQVDPTGLYLGMVEIDPEQLTSQHLPEVHECDLPALHYRWDGKTFVPLPVHQRPKAEGAPTLEQAFHALLETLPARDLPAVTQAWKQAFEQSVDAKR